ncbi:hypothetical protein [Chitinivorax sp. B]|uniref:hypothetical protein n=1 Tax=Chitinivorax sp. B TaxID=2502235 RepID=UPI0010F52077|nr:hypothetical protein [Chitinivorax sp. B]
MFADPIQTLSPAPTGNGHTLQYQVLCNNEPIGHIHVQRQLVQLAGEPALFLRNQMSLRVSGLWSDYVLDSEEEMILDGQGLSRYAGLSTEDGEKAAVTGEREGGQLTVNIKEDHLRTERFQLTDIDATSEDAAVCFLRSQRQQAVLRVLDLDHFDIDQVQFRLLPPETLALAGAERITQVVSFESRKRRTTGVGWYVPDGDGFILMREVSKEQDDRNEVILNNWEHTSCNNTI